MPGNKPGTGRPPAACPETIAAALRALFEPGDVIELRVLSYPRTRDDILHYLEKVAHFSVRYPGRNITHRSIYEPPVTFKEDA